MDEYLRKDLDDVCKRGFPRESVDSLVAAIPQFVGLVKEAYDLEIGLDAVDLLPGGAEEGMVGFVWLNHGLGYDLGLDVNREGVVTYQGIMSGKDDISGTL